MAVERTTRAACEQFRQIFDRRAMLVPEQAALFSNATEMISKSGWPDAMWSYGLDIFGLFRYPEPGHVFWSFESIRYVL